MKIGIEMLIYDFFLVNSMKLTSPDFEHEKAVPSEFTCDGADKSPVLQWNDVPDGTKSFALTCIDPDAPMGDFVHWLVQGIPVNTREIPQNGPVPGIELVNDFPKRGYGGPCPPPGHGTHRYYFTLYALDVEKLEGVTKENFISECEKHSLGKAVLMGTYKR